VDPCALALPAVAGHSSGPTVTAIVGAVTGGLALLWNVGRALREGARLRVSYYVYGVEYGEPTAAAVSIANTGTLPAYISDVGLTAHRPWLARVPLLRSASYRTLNRWWLRWAVKRTQLTQWRIHTDPDITGKLEPGEMKEGRLVEMVNGAPEPMNAVKVEHKVLTEYPFVLVETGLRRHWARVVDNRPRRP
jgi:hypothetical protein